VAITDLKMVPYGNMFANLIAAAVCVFTIVSADTYPNVKVELYYEALCPGCQQFITTTLTNTLALPDIVAITDLKMVPYGNTKYSGGVYTCQHGEDECVSDVLEMCAMYKLEGNISAIDTGVRSYDAFPFLQCMELNEGASSAAQGCWTKNMASSSVSWQTISDCYNNEYKAVQDAGRATTPTHDYVPWVLVNGKVLDNNALLTSAICKAYTGPAPASCKRLYSTDNSVCMNK